MKRNAYIEMFNVESRHWWYVGLHDLILLLAETQLPQRPLDILDAGCGTGGLLSVLTGSGHRAAGFDFSDDAVDFCHQRSFENVFKANVNKWVPAPESYDLITMMDVLCHKWVPDEVQVLKTMASGLKENGLLMLNYPAFPMLGRHHDEVVMIRERYTKKTLKTVLAGAGLSPVLLSYRLPHAYLVLVFLRFYEKLRKTKRPVKSDIADIPSAFVNNILIQLLKFENRLIARKFPIPFGSSVFVVATKK
jgi:2-polyprenyl-3-methyl-5-hydroxy-6-metoxy-1,4-benzoquinol methylase